MKGWSDHLMPAQTLVVIGFVGPQGAGKDTASCLVEELAPGAVHLRVRFTAPLYEAVEKEGYPPEQKTPERRQRLQEIGGQMRRKQGEDCLIRQAKATAQRLLQETEPPPSGIVFLHFPDVRLPREANWVRSGPKFNFTRELNFLIGLQTSEQVRSSRLPIQADSQDGLSHTGDITETAPAAIHTDFTLFNDGTIEDLKQQVRACLNAIWSYIQAGRV